MSPVLTDFFVSSPPGTVDILLRELEALGIEGRPSGPLGVAFRGDLVSAYRCCLRLRVASRLLMELGSGTARGTDGLYGITKDIPWEDHFGPEETFACRVTGAPRNEDPRYAVLKVKDAVADRFSERLGKRPSVDRAQPDIRVEVRWDGRRATVFLNLSGPPLHERGYRKEKGLAALRETVAAAVLYRLEWPRLAREGALLADPVCGSGTLLIEGALMAGDIAPGYRREEWGFSAWRGHDDALWYRLLTDETDRALSAVPELPPLIGWDRDPHALGAAGANARRAGLGEAIEWHRHDLTADIPPHWPDAPAGLIVADPPYGRRLSTEGDPGRLYEALGRVLRSRGGNWRLGVLAAEESVAGRIGFAEKVRFPVESGGLSLILLGYRIEEEERTPDPKRDRSPQRSRNQLENRIKKNLDALGKWAAKSGVTSWRLYDADLPEYNAAVDWFEGRWLHVQEYAPPKSVPPETADRRLGELVSALRELTGVDADAVYLKTRLKGRRPYGKRGAGGERFIIREAGCRFWINLSDYLDAGIFLDFRPVRKLIKDMASGGRFLNLFGYTGTASVMAAAGGAASTTTVDVSNNYLDWTRDNLVLNGYRGEEHQVVRSDVFTYLEKTADTFDLILIDPPTYSNGKGRPDFSVQEDHYGLLRRGLERLAPGGRLIFSQNYRRFRLDPRVRKKAKVREITRDTIPFDFSRKPGIHRCWLLETAI